MRILYLVTIYVTTIFNCSAQGKMRIVFFRNDAVTISPIVGYKLFYNGEKLRKMGWHEVYIREAADARGVYAMNPFPQNVLDINDNERKVRFVELKLRWGISYKRQTIREVSEEEFKALYQEKRWLRKQLQMQGYGSVEDLMVSR